MIIPAYNEELSIVQTLEDFARYQPQLEIWVVDNNSNDRTSELAKKAFAELNLKGGVILEKRQGKAFAMRTAFTFIEADYYAMIDADSTYPVKEFDRLFQLLIQENCDMVIGDRHSGGDYKKMMDRPFHNLGNKLVSKLINTLFRSQIRDIMSGYRLFSRRFIKNYPVLCAGFEIETEMTIHALDKRFKIVETPISFSQRPAGSFSKLNTYRDGYRIIKTIFGIFKDYHPFKFFSALAGLFVILALAAGTPVLTEFLNTHFITHIPLAILATGLMIFAVLFFAVALILDTVVKNQNFNYELKLIHWK